MDFDTDITEVAPFQYESNGFRFLNGRILSGSVDGTDYLGFGDPGCGGCIPLEIYIETISGAAFNLDSIDIAIGSLFPSATVSAAFAGGGSIDRSITTAGWQTQAFGAGWENIETMVISMNSNSGLDQLGIDNFSASVVPIPAAVWLFGSALAGLGWMRRKQVA
ncbi:MAG: VPLPA-CTERM sorting domain-containing protein [Gammaproteobacteria bacterium]